MIFGVLSPLWRQMLFFMNIYYLFSRGFSHPSKISMKCFHFLQPVDNECSDFTILHTISRKMNKIRLDLKEETAGQCTQYPAN